LSATERSQPTLHFLNKPPGHGRFAACLERLTPGDSLVLLEDGVLGLCHPLLRQQAPLGLALYVLKGDAEARGLLRAASDGVEGDPEKRCCDMAKLVELTEVHTRIINW
jgi:tRNA 2-thiouridine synthesizing protein B